MNGTPPTFTMQHQFQIAAPKATKALPVSYDDLAFLKTRVDAVKSHGDYYLSAGFFFLGFALSCILQYFYGSFPPSPEGSICTNQICLISAIIASVLLALGAFIFCYLRNKDTEQAKNDLKAFVDLLEGKFEK